MNNLKMEISLNLIIVLIIIFLVKWISNIIILIKIIKIKANYKGEAINKEIVYHTHNKLKKLT